MSHNRREIRCIHWTMFYWILKNTK